MRKKITKLFLALWALTFIPFYGINAQQSIEITGFGTEATDTIVPIHGAVFNSKQKSQMIYPAEKLKDLIGKEITKITLFTTQGNNIVMEMYILLFSTDTRNLVVAELTA
ncbi:MAG: hypothetical protein ACOX0V_07720 [Bacteroidales bacterium]|jgi:hypothetical protein